MFPGILTTFFILATLVVETSQEECDNMHLQEVYCNNQKVFRVKLIEKVGKTNRYKMEVLNTYKGDEKGLRINPDGTITVKVSFHKDKMTGGTYFIAGRTQRKNFFTAKCNGVVRWENTTWFQRAAFYNQYSRGCGDCVNLFDELNYEPNTYCLWKYSFFQRINFECDFKRTTEFKECTTLPS